MYTLTKTDINALRQADTLVVHFNGKDESRTSFTACKRVTEQEREREPVADYDRRYNIPVEKGDIQVRGYGYNGCMTSYLTKEQQAGVIAFGHVYLYHSQATEESTIINSLKVGDEILLTFVAGNDSEGLTEHGMTCSELQLLVMRGVDREHGKSGKALRYLLRYEVHPINSPVGMVRGLPRKAPREAVAS